MSLQHWLIAKVSRIAQIDGVVKENSSAESTTAIINVEKSEIRKYKSGVVSEYNLNIHI